MGKTSKFDKNNVNEDDLLDKTWKFEEDDPWGEDDLYDDLDPEEYDEENDLPDSYWDM